MVTICKRELRRRRARIYARGLPVLIQLEITASRVRLVITPLPGFIHMCSRSSLIAATTAKEHYHISVAFGSLAEHPGAEASVWALKAFFGVHEWQGKLSVKHLSLSTRVAQIHSSSGLISPVIHELLYLRHNHAGHHSRLLTMSM